MHKLNINEIGGVSTITPIPTVAGVNPVKSETKEPEIKVESVATENKIDPKSNLGQNLDVTV